jgi:hydantoinase/carbamoylase family amidase
MQMNCPLSPDAARVIADLRHLHEATGGPPGARRVAWSDDWERAREWLRGELAELPVQVEVDAGGNLWARLPGAGPGTVAVGSHLDSVPEGGWLDGALGVAAGLEVLRAQARLGTPRCTLTLVDWADEEGARFGVSLLGSSLAAGGLQAAGVAGLRDAGGRRLADVLATRGVELEQAAAAGGWLDGVSAYLELHIEQGPVLEAEGLAVAAVAGTVGVQRHVVVFGGRSGHAGTTPMAGRRDPMAAAARFVLEARDCALAAGGVATIGRLDAAPGITTAIPATCRLALDQRHADAGGLALMLDAAHRSAADAAREEGCDVAWEPVFAAAPADFDPHLVDLAAGVCEEVGGARRVLRSGALHDATAVSRRVPTAMLFCSSAGGISHAADEDTPLEHLELGVRCLARLADLAMQRVAG